MHNVSALLCDNMCPYLHVCGYLLSSVVCVRLLLFFVLGFKKKCPLFQVNEFLASFAL